MNWRKQELILGDAVAWLSGSSSAEWYESALSGCSQSRYGLSEDVWDVFARIDVDDPTDEDAATAVFASLIGTEDVLLVYGKEDVAKVSADCFLKNWRGMFLPSRDDVVLLPASREWCIFYCHENEFECGRRKKTAEPCATDNPDDAQRLREDY